jgi:hypothetical protein
MSMSIIILVGLILILLVVGAVIAGVIEDAKKDKEDKTIKNK